MPAVEKSWDLCSPEWEAEGGVVWCSQLLSWTEGQLAVVPCMFWCVSWAVLATSAVIQPSNQVISCLHCTAIPSALAWDGMTHFPSPLASFVFSLCFYSLFLTLVFFFQSRQNKNFFIKFLSITRSIQQTRVTNSHTPLCLSVALSFFLRGTALCSLQWKK